MAAPIGAAAAEGAATALPHRVDTSALSRADLLLATLYNEHRLLYALATTLAMASVGVAIALAVDLALERFGLRISRARSED